MLNCTTYVNLMMAIWAVGHAHGRPFDAKVAGAGGAFQLPKDRFGYPLIGVFTDLPKLTEQIKHPHKLYCLGYGDAVNSGGVGHYALLLDGRVYECNIFGISCVRDVSLAHWWSSHPYVTLYGPSPVH